MINLFVTYRCNLSCAYCFARELQPEHAEDIRPSTFRKLLKWMDGRGIPAVAFLGGEPTLHPRLAEMIEATRAAGITSVLFTNGLFAVKLADRLARSVSNFVVNYNDPSLYGANQRKQLHLTLGHLSQRGAQITFSKNFTKGCVEYGYLLQGAERYGVRAVRYDFSRPGGNAANDYLSTDDTRRLMRQVVTFVRKCEEKGVRTGLDCCVRFCDLPEEELAYLRKVSMKFTGICHPSIDIHPDLSASYCLPLRDVRVADVTAFAGTPGLMRRLAESVRSERYAGVGQQCVACHHFQHTCQGGCLALKRHSPATRCTDPGRK